MTANSFIAVDERLSAPKFRHSLSGFWGISAVSKFSACIQNGGRSSAVSMNRNYKKNGMI